MANKPDGRKVKNSNNEHVGNDKKPNQARYQKPKVDKAKGPRPDYTRKHDHEAERKRQILMQEISTERARFPMFCDGIEGPYLIGRNIDNRSEWIGVTVKVREGASGEFRIIERADGIFIPHVWLFIRLEKCHFALGHIGAEQHRMLSFLQEILRGEILEAKQKHWELQQAAKAPTSVGTPVVPAVEKDLPKTADIIPIQDKMLGETCRPITDLMSEDCFGIYSAPDEKGQLVLELRRGNFGNEFVVKKLTPGHHLSAHLLYGSIINVHSVATMNPEFDQHIRALLEISGIRLSTVKSSRGKHAHVTKGLPNVHKATQLSA